MKYPPNFHSTSSKEKLSNGPKDMPDLGGAKPDAHITASMVPLSRKENPVAAFGAKPQHGQHQHDGATHVNLSRKVSLAFPEAELSATHRHFPFQGASRTKKA